jgi:hypothetical protein
VRDFGQRFAVADLTRDDAVQLADCQTWLAGEPRRRALIVELRDQTPQAVDVSVSAAEHGGLDAVLVYPAETLARLATGWRFRDGAVAPGTPAGGWQPLVLAGVLPAKGPTSCTLDVVFPARGAEPRVWLFEFGTVGLVVSLLADDSVVAAIVDARDLSRSEALQRAMREPLTQVALQEAAVAATPGAVHRLTLRVEPVRGARYGVQALLDGAVVARGIRELDAERRASVTIEPLQLLELHSIELRASGL